MDIGKVALQERVDRFTEGLKSAGVKLTHQRLEIFREVAKSPAHPDVEAVFRGVRKRVSTISIDTVYRTLWSLIDLGLLSTVGHSRERARFDANMRSHHHFVCVRCGDVSDFYSEEFDRLDVPDVVKALGNAGKMQVEIQGVCNRCSAKGKPKSCATRRKEAR